MSEINSSYKFVLFFFMFEKIDMHDLLLAISRNTPDCEKHLEKSIMYKRGRRMKLEKNICKLVEYFNRDIFIF